jgi:AcrR family transcriptional regulator
MADISASSNRKNKTRIQILQSALTCFADKGYHQTAMDDIVTASGLSKGALYWHFKSKQELFIALLEWFFAEFGEEVSHAGQDDMIASEKLRAIMDVSLASSEQFIPFFKVFLDFWAQTSEDEKVLQIFDGVLQGFWQKIQLIIEEGIATGEFRPVNASQLALSFLGMLDSLFLYKTLLGDNVDMRGSAETAFEVILTGLKCQE